MKDPNNTRDTVPRRGSPMWVYVASVTAAGVVALALSLVSLHPGELARLAHGPLFWILACLILFGELKPIITQGSTETSGATPSTSFTFATMLYAGLPTALLLQTIATIVTGGLRRRAPYRTAFNVAQYTLSFAGSALVLMLFGIRPSPGELWVPDGPDLLPIGLAGVLYFMINFALVNAAITLHERVSLIKVMR